MQVSSRVHCANGLVTFHAQPSARAHLVGLSSALVFFQNSQGDFNTVTLNVGISWPQVCQYCGTTSTPVWRKAGQAKDVILCNACSLRLRRSERRSPEKPSPCKAKQQVSPPPEKMEGKPGRDELPVDDVMHKYPPPPLSHHPQTTGISSALWSWKYSISDR